MGLGLAMIWLAAVGPASHAEVVNKDTYWFTVESIAEIGAPADEVWEALVERVGSWWSPAHTYSGEARNLSIEAEPGGCFCERWEGGGAVHLTVLNADPSRLLRLEGSLGPLQAEAVRGVMSWQLVPAEDGTTTLTLDYRVVGHIPSGVGGWAQTVDSVLAEQLQRLERFIETGAPD